MRPWYMLSRPSTELSASSDSSESAKRSGTSQVSDDSAPSAATTAAAFARTHFSYLTRSPIPQHLQLAHTARAANDLTAQEVQMPASVARTRGRPGHKLTVRQCVKH